MSPPIRFYQSDQIPDLRNPTIAALPSSSARTSTAGIVWPLTAVIGA